MFHPRLVEFRKSELRDVKQVYQRRKEKVEDRFEDQQSSILELLSSTS
jgi:hypothetical protein